MSTIAKHDAEEKEEAEAAVHFHGGSASAYEQASEMIMEMARNFFAVGKDDEAKLLRQVAQTLVRSGADEREKQKQHQEVVDGG